MLFRSMIKKENFDTNVLKPFVLSTGKINSSNNSKIDIKSLFPVAGVKELTTLSQAAEQLLHAASIIFIDGIDTAFSIPPSDMKRREISEPETEKVVRGPKEGFVENIATNRLLIREKIKNPNLVFNNMTIGRQTNTIISICYIKGIVNQNVLKEVRRRLSNIDTDSILESGYLEQFIEDAPMSLLATVGNSEKPDIIAGKLLEGRVAILCDGTPNVLTVPFLFVENLQSSEDYYSRLYISSMLRILRVIALWISLFLAPIYVAIETYHQEMIPTVLLTTMMGASSHIPLPAFVEATLMLLMFQLLRESGTRLQIGRASCRERV